MRHKKRVLFLLIPLILLFDSACAVAEGYKYRLPASKGKWTGASTLIGSLQDHAVSPGETLLDVARNYGLGFHEIEILYPKIDPWIPEAGTHLVIPTMWVLPPTKHQGIVVNIPELRLYRFFPRTGLVKTYPVGIGDLDTETPLGTYRVARLDKDPEWRVPPERRERYGVGEIMPPGPDNPLGQYWIGLSNRKYGIHGTNNAWSIGRSVSGGCVRLYPEHIRVLFREVSAGTHVEIVYEPVKFGSRDGEIFIEVHPDLYEKIEDMTDHTKMLLRKLGIENRVSWKKIQRALARKNGVPVSVGSLVNSGDIGR